ncbi:MAG TPA: VOC family protein [Opitutaceae bacterium]|nr:VOC family protein [Opitutaceae bacterium]
MLQLRHVRLRVADLARSLDFYAGRIGLHPVRESSGSVGLAAAVDGPELLALVEDRGAEPAPRDAAGLFHAAMLLPGRAALGRWLRQAADAGVAFDGFSDHGVSEAIYLADPDGNGLEFYADRPSDAWPRRGDEIAMSTEALNLPDLLAAGARPSDGGVLAGARWGHLHLRVTELERSEAFYRDALGMAVTQRSYPGARFLAADGYHHHLGLNTWGHPRRPQPAGSLGLVDATFTRADTAAEKSLVDPDGIRVRLGPA